MVGEIGNEVVHHRIGRDDIHRVAGDIGVQTGAVREVGVQRAEEDAVGRAHGVLLVEALEEIEAHCGEL